MKVIINISEQLAFKQNRYKMLKWRRQINKQSDSLNKFYIRIDIRYQVSYNHTISSKEWGNGKERNNACSGLKQDWVCAVAFLDFEVIVLFHLLCLFFSFFFIDVWVLTADMHFLFFATVIVFNLHVHATPFVISIFAFIVTSSFTHCAYRDFFFLLTISARVICVILCKHNWCADES